MMAESFDFIIVGSKILNLVLKPFPIQSRQNLTQWCKRAVLLGAPLPQRFPTAQNDLRYFFLKLPHTIQIQTSE
jgi:hypothetical protein